MDRVGQDVHRDVRLDREHALVDRRGGVGAGDRRADQLPRAAVDDDRDVPQLGLERVAAAALREVGDLLERVDALLLRGLERDTDERRLGVGVGGAGQRTVVGRDLLARRHPRGQLTLVVGLVRVELGAGRIADARRARRRSASRPSRGYGGVRPLVSSP